MSCPIMETDELANSRKYEHSQADYRSGQYKINFQTIAWEAELNLPGKKVSRLGLS